MYNINAKQKRGIIYVFLWVKKISNLHMYIVYNVNSQSPSDTDWWNNNFFINEKKSQQRVLYHKIVHLLPKSSCKISLSLTLKKAIDLPACKQFCRTWTNGSYISTILSSVDCYLIYRLCVITVQGDKARV